MIRHQRLPKRWPSCPLPSAICLSTPTFCLLSSVILPSASASASLPPTLYQSSAICIMMAQPAIGAH